MKRSEAERLINNWLDVAPEITGVTLIEFLTTTIGMQPPLYTKNPDVWYRSTFDYGYEVSEWEDEA